MVKVKVVEMVKKISNGKKFEQKFEEYLDNKGTVYERLDDKRTTGKKSDYRIGKLTVECYQPDPDHMLREAERLDEMIQASFQKKNGVALNDSYHEYYQTDQIDAEGKRFRPNNLLGKIKKKIDKKQLLKEHEKGQTTLVLVDCTSVCHTLRWPLYLQTLKDMGLRACIKVFYNDDHNWANPGFTQSPQCSLAVSKYVDAILVYEGSFEEMKIIPSDRWTLDNEEALKSLPSKCTMDTIELIKP